MERSFPDSDPLTHEYQKVSRDKESHQSNAGKLMPVTTALEAVFITKQLVRYM